VPPLRILFRPVFFDCRDFGWDGVQRHENDATHSSNLGRVRKTLAVISGGEGDDASLALLRTETQNGVESPARLERASALQVLRFEAEPRPGQAAKRCGVKKRSAVNVRGDAGSGRPHVIDRDVGSFCAVIGSSGFARRRGDFLRSSHLLQHSLLPFARRCRP
jgi:hypothetical protein